MGEMVGKPRVAYNFTKKRKKFDPEGRGYDYEAAAAGGVVRDAKGHMGSRSPKTGQMLKGRRHETHAKAMKGERDAGYEVYRRGHPSNYKYYSRKKK